MRHTQKNTHPPRVSVLMTTYNGERFLGDAVASILSQSFTSLELIVIDDGSTDSSASIIRFFCARDSRVRGVFLDQNVGIPNAANHGLGFARGEYVARMDADDLCHRDRLLRQVSYLDKHRDVHVLGCRYRAIDEGGSFCSDAYARRFKQDIIIPSGRRRLAARVLLGHYPVLHPSIICRRSTLVSIGGYRDFFPIGEDNDLYFRLVSLHGAVLDNLSKKLFYYRHYGSSITQRFDRSTRMLMMSVLTFSSEFCRRGFWDPLASPPSKDCQSLRFRGVSSFLFIQDSLEYLPSCPRARLYHLLRVVMILRRFGLKNFNHISLWNDWGMTLRKQFYFYLYFCIICFRLRKFRAGFLYLYYIIKMRHDVLLVSLAKSLAKKIFGDTSNSFNTLYNIIYHWYMFRYFIFTQHWYLGLKNLFFAFCTSPSYTIKFLVCRFFSHFVSILCFPFRKLGR